MKPKHERCAKLVLAALWLLFIYAAGFSGWVGEDGRSFQREASSSSYLNGAVDGMVAAAADEDERAG